MLHFFLYFLIKLIIDISFVLLAIIIVMKIIMIVIIMIMIRIKENDDDDDDVEDNSNNLCPTRFSPEANQSRPLNFTFSTLFLVCAGSSTNAPKKLFLHNWSDVIGPN